MTPVNGWHWCEMVVQDGCGRWIVKDDERARRVVALWVRELRDRGGEKNQEMEKEESRVKEEEKV